MLFKAWRSALNIISLTFVRLDLCLFQQYDRRVTLKQRHFCSTPLAGILRKEHFYGSGFRDKRYPRVPFTARKCTIWLSMWGLWLLWDDAWVKEISISELCITDYSMNEKIMFDMKRFPYVMCASLFQQQEHGGDITVYKMKWEINKAHKLKDRMLVYLFYCLCF